MAHRRRSKGEWTAICQDYEASGDTAAVFAHRRRLNRNTLLWWHCKLRREAPDPPAVRGFVEVVAETTSRCVHTVVRVGQVAVEFSDGPPAAAWLAELASRC